MCIVNVFDFIKGVVNLCGVIVLIVDLCIKFCFECVDYDDQIVVIVVNIVDWVVGIVVDWVFDVMMFIVEQCKLVLEFGLSLLLDYISGLGNLDECMLVLVDIEKMFISEEMVLVEEVGE